MFAGIDSKARKAAGTYIGVDGVARRAKKLYMGVDGKARLCWEAGSGSGGGESSGVRAYLYNGVKLPELPEWDRAAYPYAVIDEAVLRGVYRLHLFEHLPYAKTTESGGCYYGPMDGSTYVYKGIVSETDHYWDFNAAQPDDDGIYTKNVVWCNFELLNEDGTTYLEASDPVPLYSYNGVELPELPEWDNTKFPKCTIDYFPVLRKYYFRAFAPDAYYFYSNGKLYFGSNYSSGVLVQSSIASIVGNYGAWSELKENDIGNTSVTETFWANFDMEYEGTLYMAASEPQPVYF